MAPSRRPQATSGARVQAASRNPWFAVMQNVITTEALVLAPVNKMKRGNIVVGSSIACVLLGLGLFALLRSGSSVTSQSNPQPLITSLFGHWVDAGGNTHRYFDTDMMIMVDGNRVRPQAYRVIDSREPDRWLKIECRGQGDQYSLPGAKPVFYELVFTEDRKAVSTRTYLRESDKPIPNSWRYVDTTRKP